MASPLTIRNLTSNPIYLKLIESFEDPNSLQSKPSAFPFASKNISSSAPSAPKLGEHAQTFHRQEPNIQLVPFESYTTKSQSLAEDVRESLLSRSLVLRITIEAPNGDRHRIDTNPTYTQKSSLNFVPLSPAPSHSFRALYHPGTPTSHLTIQDTFLNDLSSWMSLLPSTLPLSAISIPGTHNSHTHYRALPSVRCQSVPVKTQLENGIRFLDIRVMPAQAGKVDKKDLYLVHGAFPVSLTGSKYFEPILETCYDFLDRHKSETILLSLKREGTGSSTDEELSQILDKYYISPHKDKWYLGPEIPYLKDVRGKLVLIRRYKIHESVKTSPESNYYGLDATSWPHNSTHAIHGPFCVQDYCEIMKPSMIPEKLGYSKEHLARAAECTAFIPGVNTDKTNPVPSGPLYLNFLSGSNFWNAGTWPEKVSLPINRGIEEWICKSHHLEHPSNLEEDERKEREQEGQNRALGVVKRVQQGDGGTGVVVMDWVGHGSDWDLVKLIISLNTALASRIKDSQQSN
ncbi:1-phosphatidylinositol phosphodiesterase precursor [Delitschia confertaspora ATCC 74209]|uniref:1-phosphatidylinositol phosphodiesterase n=1 Tax=Delitschia confertaspora ATCC 74209 TaxID=1513339 RepID=A0A9P4JF12_9PLEO|nr:1-phosphatidylinositol phosphodiesterase precursor [Delitschia confertaspora ATCC 74209]